MGTVSGIKLQEGRGQFNNELKSLVEKMIKRLPSADKETLSEQEILNSKINFGKGRINAISNLSPRFEQNKGSYVDVSSKTNQHEELLSL